ncbi:MAG: DUF2336 domain-containing protein [Rhodobiaceae bacterium]|nr:DUF2336 domain-containing protein [Rhodobiaceae bacterium]MCC0042353.1 DUF2336 domain-containing protein [Rhodobiaceae bacterium]
MYVRRFLARLEQGNAAERAEVVSALAGLFCEQELDGDKRRQVTTAMFAVLDDPAVRVRKALAEGLADALHAPPAILQALCDDVCEVAAPVLARSPALSEGWLVDMCGAGSESHRVAIARRTRIGVPLAAALAEIGGVPSCLTLLANAGASVARSSLARMVERHRGDARLRSALLARDDLSPTLRHRLVGGLSEALSAMLADKGWLPGERAERLMSDVEERATLDVADGCEAANARELARVLHVDGKLTVTLLLRALVRAQLAFFEAAMAELTGAPAKRVAALLSDRSGSGFRSLYRKTRLPADGAGAIWAALDVLFEMGPIGSHGERLTAGRRMVERVLSRYEAVCGGEVDAFYALLTRLAADEAREAARADSGGYFKAA